MVPFIISLNRDRKGRLKIFGETIRRSGTEAAAYAHFREAGVAEHHLALGQVEVERLARTALRRATVAADPQCAPWGTPD